MKIFLCIGALCGLLALMQQAFAQNTNANNFSWPDVPEINDPPAQDPNGRHNGQTGQGGVLSAWPGTDHPGSDSAAVPDAPQPETTAATPQSETTAAAPETAVETPETAPQPVTRSNKISVSRQRSPNPTPSIPARLVERNDPSGEESVEIEVLKEPETVNEKEKAEAGAADAQLSTSGSKPETPDDPTGVISDRGQTGNAVDTDEAGASQDNAAIEDQAIPPALAHTAHEPISSHADPSAVVPVNEDDVLEKMMGQMIVTGFDGFEPDDYGVMQAIKGISTGRIGGLIIKGRNIRSPSQLKRLMEALRKAETGPPPFLIVEHAGGTGQALSADKGFSIYPSAGELGQSNDPLSAFNVYQHMAEELASYGFNVNLGPVLELQSGEQNSTLQTETRYGSSAKHVAAFTKAFQLAHEQMAIMTAPKLFVGNGAARKEQPGPESPGNGPSQDGRGVPVFQLYRELLSGTKTPMVMIGHAVARTDPSDQSDIPASLSERAVQIGLRDGLNFGGIVITADLETPGLAKRFSMAERVVLAIGAGNDVLQIGGVQDLDRFVTVFKDAIAQDKIPRDRIELSYKRILAVKQTMTGAAKAIASVVHGQGGNQPASR